MTVTDVSGAFSAAPSTTTVVGQSRSQQGPKAVNKIALRRLATSIPSELLQRHVTARRGGGFTLSDDGVRIVILYGNLAAKRIY
jgi:guanyl-specific ribonuclease Sa